MVILCHWRKNSLILLYLIIILLEWSRKNQLIFKAISGTYINSEVLIIVEYKRLESIIYTHKKHYR
jgi:hypothetical protein